MTRGFLASSRTVLSMETGSTVGAYKVFEKIGHGGMGVVLRARDPQGRIVAFKRIHAHLVDDDSRARLAREVATLRRIDHDGVARIVDADLECAEPFIVTEFVDGPTLDDYVAAHGPLSGNELAFFGQKLGEAIAKIHSSDVIHRDVKPTNVLVRDGAPVIIDFGVAHIVDASRITQTGLVMGTPGYLAPENLKNAPITVATDWWGWAATMVFAATGRHPFGTGSVDAVLARLSAGEPDLTGCPQELKPILAGSLLNDPGQRPEPAQLRVAMEEYAAAHPPAELPTTVLSSSATVTLPGAHRDQPTEAVKTADPTVAAAGKTQNVSPPSAQPKTYYPTPPPVPTQATPVVETGPVTQLQRTTTSWWSRQILGPGRSVLLALLLVCIVAIGALAPPAALGVGAVWSVLALVVTNSLRALHRRREETGDDSGGAILVALGAPLRLIPATLRLVMPLLFAVGCGLFVGMVIDLMTREYAPMTGKIAAAAAATLVASVLMWRGRLGADLRYGSRVLMRGASPQVVSASVVALVLILVTLAALKIVMGDHFVPSWTPFTETPWDSVKDVIDNNL